MPMYLAERKLPSCQVTPELLREVEEYVFTAAKELGVNLDCPWCKWHLGERAGESVLDSMKNFSGSHFHSATESVLWHLDSMGTRKPSCEIHMSLEKKGSWLTVKLSGIEDERSKAIAIAESIKEKFSAFSNRNHLFHLHPVIGGLLLWMVIVPVVMPGLYGRASRYFLPLLCVVGFTWLYLAIGSVLLPCAQLSTRKNDAQSARFWKLTWLFIALLAGTLLSMFRGYFRLGGSS